MPKYLLLQVFLDFLLCIPIPYSGKNIFFGYSFQKVVQVFIERFYFSFFSISDRGIDLDYHDIKWLTLETNRDHSVIILDCIHVLHFELMLVMMASPVLLRDSCPQQQILWSSELNSPIPVHFSFDSQNVDVHFLPSVI